ncbi:hypothetical protein [Pseudomonas abietaniphila]|uniref:hypothetical protein n=1 Tax=Pseudomonas abietaniphila TaxID=89065 RepID=UPI0007824271|nr:hypothetical protein [Pseudomonas abietaniphila]
MTTDAFTISDGKISVHGKVLLLPHPVTEAKSYLDLIIVKVESPAGTIFNRNVFGLSRNGEFRWQIQESEHGTQQDKPYIDILINPDGALIAANWNGVNYLVDSDNGKITIYTFDK